MPKYIEIANILRERIENEIYAKGSLLPNQTDLVREFHVSRTTIKKAVSILIMEGLLFSKRGAGTTVLNHPFLGKETSAINEYAGLSYQMKRQNRPIESQVITFEVKFPDEKIQEKLMISEKDPVYEIMRLRILDEKPYVLEHSFMPVSLVPGLTLEILHHSVYDYLLQTLGHHFAGAYRTISAAKSDFFDQEYLRCKRDDPVLEVEQVIYLEDGRPIDYSTSHNRYDTRGYSILDVKYSSLD